MMLDNRKYLFAALLIFAVTIFSSHESAWASLSAKYEKPAAGAKQSEATSYNAIKTTKTTQAAASVSGEKTLASFKIPGKYLKAINKEHATFVKACIDAEMGMRYFFKTGYDATKGKKTPSADQIKAMRFEIKLLMKDLQSSAKRYARNIQMARIAMKDMTPEEQTFFARALSRIAGTPAYASGQTLANSMAGLENALNQTAVKSGTLEIGIDKISPSDFAKVKDKLPETLTTWEKIASSRAAHIGAAAAKLGSTIGLSLAAICGGAALVSTAPVTGGVMVIGGILAGGFEFVSSACGFIDAVNNKETDEAQLKPINDAAKYVKPLTLINPGKGVVEVVTNILEGTSDYWVPMITESGNPDNPGKDGSNAVKNASDTSSGGGSNGGNGGSGGGGCGGGCN